MKKNNIMLAGSNTQVGMIRDLYLAGKSKREAFSALRPLVDSQTPPMVFSMNIENPMPGQSRRQPKPLSDQYIALEHHIARIYKELAEQNYRPGQPPMDDDENGNENDDQNDEIIEDTDDESETIEDEDPSEDEKPIASGKKRRQSELEKFLTEARRLRNFCLTRERELKYVDDISLRPINAAAKLIPNAGIPADACIAAMTLNWSDGTKVDAGIRAYDFKALSRQIAKDRNLPKTITRKNGKVEMLHEMFGYALTLAENRIPIYLCGPAGTGKSHLIKQLADYMNLPYGEAAMSPGATRGDLLGRNTISGVDRAMALSALLRVDNLGEMFPDEPDLKSEIVANLRSIMAGEGGGFISSEYQERFANGGLFNLDEIDSADAGMLIVINNAMESDEMFNTASGRTVKKALDYIVAATANTWGDGGANSKFTGRKKLDFATLDRFRMGRIFVDLDPALEEHLLFQNVR